MSRRILLGLALLAFASTSLADGTRDTPDQRGEVWGTDTHPRGYPRAQVVLTHRQRNTVGTDFSGLCVIASVVNALHTQGYHQEAEALWAEAKRRPGGYGPEKLRRLINDVCPHLQWVSIVNDSTTEAERLLRAGIPVSATMSTGRLYNYRRIHHFVNPVYLGPEWAAVVDNNKPEVTAWMPRPEYDRRYLDGSTGWAVAFASKVKTVAQAWPALVAIGLVVGFLAQALRTPREDP